MGAVKRNKAGDGEAGGCHLGTTGGGLPGEAIRESDPEGGRGL